MEICSQCGKKHNEGYQHVCTSRDLLPAANNQLILDKPDGSLWRVTLGLNASGALIVKDAEPVEV